MRKAGADLDPGHPQFGLKQLLRTHRRRRARMCKDWFDAPANPARETLLRETLRPAPTTDAWRALAEDGARRDRATGLNGIALIEAADPAQEALAIALALREALETPGRTAALVTPDRNLARRVAAEMTRWDIAIDDSAGRPLAHTARRHASSACWRKRPRRGSRRCRCWRCSSIPSPARGQDRRRFPRPGARAGSLVPARTAARSGPCGHRQRHRQSRPARACRRRRRPWRAWRPGGTRSPPSWRRWKTIFAQGRGAARCLLDDPSRRGGGAGLRREGKTACCGRTTTAKRRRSCVAALQDCGAGPARSSRAPTPPLFRNLAMKTPVRAAFGRHPRLAILGPLEARLQRFDLIVLGGLNEGTWPRARRRRSLVLAADARDAGPGTARTQHRPCGARFRHAGGGAARAADPRAEGRRRADHRLALAAAADATDARAWSCDEALAPRLDYAAHRARADGRAAGPAPGPARAHAAGRGAARAACRSPRSRPGCAILTRSMPSMC